MKKKLIPAIMCSSLLIPMGSVLSAITMPPDSELRDDIIVEPLAVMVHKAQVMEQVGENITIELNMTVLAPSCGNSQIKALPQNKNGQYSVAVYHYAPINTDLSCLISFEKKTITETAILNL